MRSSHSLAVVLLVNAVGVKGPVGSFQTSFPGAADLLCVVVQTPPPNTGAWDG